MEDSRIVELIYSRNQSGINETTQKYGKLLTSIAQGVLKSREDCEECVNDTYLKMWQSIPPSKPEHYKAYICKAARRIALDKYRKNHAKSRSIENCVCFDELDFEIGGNYTENEVFSNSLREDINIFMRALPQESRVLFIRRCFMLESNQSLAKRFDMTESNVRVKVMRIRNDLKKYLNERGYCVE